MWIFKALTNLRSAFKLKGQKGDASERTPQKKEVNDMEVTPMSNNNLQHKLNLVKEIFEKGFVVVPSKPNEEGLFKVPVWSGKVEEQVWNYEKFLEKVKDLKDFGFGTITGRQPNGLYVNVLDCDVDKPSTLAVKLITEAVERIAKSEEHKEKLLLGMELTQSGRWHYFFLTEEPVEVKTTKVEKGEKITKSGKVKGAIEFFGEQNKRFVATYEGVIHEFDKKPVLLRDLPILSKEEAKVLLESLGFKFEGEESQESGRVKSEVKRELVSYYNEELAKAKAIIPYLKALREKGILTGYDFDLVIPAWLVDSGVPDEEIKKVVAEFYEEEYDEKLTEYMIRRAKERPAGDKISIGTLIYHLRQYDDEDARAVLGILGASENEYKGFRLPPRYRIVEGRLYKLNKRGDDKRYVSEACVITKKYLDETGRLVGGELEFYDGTKVNFSSFSSEAITEAFHRAGLLMSKEEAREVVKYLRELEALNKDKILKQKVVSRTGWSEDFKEFYLPQTSEVLFLDDVKGFGAKGDKEKELSLMKELVESGHHVALGYALAFASPLVKLVDSGNFTVFIQGFTGKGKTTIGAIALSVFGFFRALKRDFNTTDTGLEILLSKHQDVFNLVDEINTGRGDVLREIVKTIYNFEQGIGRTRAKKNLQLQETRTFSGILAFTSETDFRVLFKKAEQVVKGAFRRAVVIDLGKYPAISESLAVKIYKSISQNYGNLIKDYVDYLIQNQEAVKGRYEELLNQMEREGYRLKGLERYYSVLLLATDLMGEVFGVDTKLLKERLYEQMFFCLETAKREIAINKETLIEKIMDFFTENQNHFEFEEVRELEEKETEDGKKEVDKEVILHRARDKVYGKYECTESLSGKKKKHTFYLTSIGLEALASYVGITKRELTEYLVSFGLSPEGSSDTRIKRTKVRFSIGYLNVYPISWEEEEVEEEKERELEEVKKKLLEQGLLNEEDLEEFDRLSKHLTPSEILQYYKLSEEGKLAFLEKKGLLPLSESESETKSSNESTEVEITF